MKDRKDERQEGFITEGTRDWSDAGKEEQEYMTGGMQDWTDAGQEA